MTNPILKGHVSRIGSLPLIVVEPGTEIAGPNGSRLTVDDGMQVRHAGLFYLTERDYQAIVRRTKPLPTDKGI